MTIAPKIDTRSAKDIFEKVLAELGKRPETQHIALSEDPMAMALVRVFSRYCELVIERLNKAPEKNYLAFLNLLGISRIPPHPAQVALTFYPAKRAPQTNQREADSDRGFGTRPVVRRYTKIAAPPAGGSTEPIVFETERELVLTHAELKRVLSLDPREDRYADLQVLATEKGGTGVRAFGGNRGVPHELYIGNEEIFGSKGLAELRLRFEMEGEPEGWASGQMIRWHIPTPKGDVVLIPREDQTRQLTRSGEVVFDKLPKWPANDVFGRATQWLCCRLLVPPKLDGVGANAAVNGVRLPQMRAITIAGSCEVQDALVEHAFFNSLPIDHSKDFFPLGERPRFGDVLYLGCSEFGRQGATIELYIELTNPSGATTKLPIPPVNKIGQPRLQWEIPGGQHWRPLECRDGTEALTESGVLTFTVPSVVTEATIHGASGFWIRAHLVSGNYGEDPYFEFVEAPSGPGVRRTPSTLAPPAIHAIRVRSEVSLGPQTPKVAMTRNNLVLRDIKPGERVAFSAFEPADNPCPRLYLGFDGGLGTQSPIDLYCHVGEPGRRVLTGEGGGVSAPLLVWEYWNGEGWSNCRAKDETGSLATSGNITVWFGEDISPWQESSEDPALDWLRVLWRGTDLGEAPTLRRIGLNTVGARHTVTLEDELLGSSNERPGQVFSTTRVPILGDVHLEVKELDVPTEEELRRICCEEGDDAIRYVKNAKGLIRDVWVRWHEVEDFLAAGPADRHFLVDRLSGEIRFGDGVRGLIPPAGTSNIRLKMYKTGGGSAGNVPAGSVTQLRTAVPGVQSVRNLEAASGGQDVEEWTSVRRRGARRLRHRWRAVTVEDYEDLAMEASTAVARAKVLPLRDLARDPSGATAWPGTVSLIVVPQGNEVRPKPTMSLLRQVRTFLEDHGAPDPELVILAPEYVQIGVDVEVVPARDESGSAVIAECERRLEAFLHPLTGGEGPEGWHFGQQPHDSDLYALLEGVPGIGYVRSLRVRMEEERAGLLQSGLYLISSGQHRLREGAS